jgi:hypothetical protein
MEDVKFLEGYFMLDDMELIVDILRCHKSDYSLSEANIDSLNKFIDIFDKVFNKSNEFSEHGIDRSRLRCCVDPKLVIIPNKE